MIHASLIHESNSVPSVLLYESGHFETPLCCIALFNWHTICEEISKKEVEILKRPSGDED
jgi:hypothetical protein